MGYSDDRLVEFLPWAYRFARNCTARLPMNGHQEDLQSAGVFGYLQAASRYDMTRGAPFRAYCALRIQGAVLDELRKWSWAPRSVYQLQRSLNRVTSALLEQLGRLPTQQELARALDLTEDELAAHETHGQRRQLLSLEELGENEQGDDNLSLLERLADPHAARPDADIELAEDRQAVRQCLRTLPKQQLTIIVLHYLQGVPLREVAKLLCVTPSRVSQVHHQALGQLKRSWRRVHGPTHYP